MSSTPFVAPFELEIPRHLNDKRFDGALTVLLREKFPEQPSFSRAFLTEHIKEGTILLNGARVLPRSLVATHDRVQVLKDIAPVQVSLKPSREPVAIEKLFEDEAIIAVNKGASVQMHEGGSYAGVTVAQWILTHYPMLENVGEDPLRPGIVHRLDRETSGVLVIAKTEESFRALKKVFQTREAEKTYIALVYGHLSSLEGKIDTALMRKPGELKRRAIDLESYTGDLPGNTRTALTFYRVIARYQDYDLVMLTPKTGRTHQIRVHLSSLGHPVVGDKLYTFKGTKRSDLLFSSRHMLHATRLSFALFGKKYLLHSPLPEDFRQVLRDIDETRVSSYDGEALKSLLEEL